MASEKFARLEKLMPALLAEMRVDLRDCPLCRDFFVLKRIWGFNDSDGEYFKYYYEDHPQLDGQTRILQNSGLIWDVGDGNTKRYVISEELAEYLTGDVAEQIRSAESRYSFRKEKRTWTLSFEGKTIHVPDKAGLRYIAELMRQPGVEIKATELRGIEDGRAPMKEIAGIPLADETAIKTVRSELSRKRDELTALRANDLTRKEVLEDQVRKLEKYLRQVTDIRGQARRAQSSADRARVAVTNAITRAMDEIAEHHTALAAHLKESIKTGSALIYRASDTRDWHF